MKSTKDDRKLLPRGLIVLKEHFLSSLVLALQVPRVIERGNKDFSDRKQSFLFVRQMVTACLRRTIARKRKQKC